MNRWKVSLRVFCISNQEHLILVGYLLEHAFAKYLSGKLLRRFSISGEWYVARWRTKITLSSTLAMYHRGYSWRRLEQVRSLLLLDFARILIWKYPRGIIVESSRRNSLSLLWSGGHFIPESLRIGLLILSWRNLSEREKLPKIHKFERIITWLYFPISVFKRNQKR